MKLVFAIVHNEDSHKVTKDLNENGFSVTKLSSTGGFLRSGNTTLLVGVEEENLDDVIGIIEKNSRSRTQLINYPIPAVGIEGMLVTNPVEVVVGGATIFVTNVERFEKV